MTDQITAGRMLTARQVAEICNVSLWTVRDWARKGMGPPTIRVGPQSIRYARSDVDQWLRARRSSPTAPG